MNKRIKKKKLKNKLRMVNNMAVVAIKQQASSLQIKLDYISSKATVLKANKDMIQLDRTNPKHIEWYETDKYKGK